MDRLDVALDDVEQLDLDGLRARWRVVYGSPAPPTFRVALLRAAVAYKLQERALGGLRPSTRGLLRRVAEQADHARRHRSGEGKDLFPAGEVLTLESAALTMLRPAESPPGSAPGGSGDDGGVEHTRAPSRPRQARLRIKPGTRLLRTWQGATHEVLVGEDHVTYRGRQHRSLSEVARLITGQRWSGPLFFGLKRPSSARGASPARPADPAGAR